MKCIVLSNSQYRKKTDGSEGYIANVAFFRPQKQDINVQQIFNFPNIKSGDLIDVQTDLNGYVMSCDVIGNSDCVNYLIEELK